MKRSEFMAELKTALNGHMKETEIVEVLADYEEFFETGISEGETEEQVADRLGHPARIALSLINKKPQAEDGSEIAAPAVYKRIAAFIIDILVPSLPFAVVALNAALYTFFYPLFLPNIIRSFLSTVLVSNHTWIAPFRGLWVAAVCLAGIWWYFINPASMLLFKGQTVGMKLTGVAVVSSGHGRASWIQYFVREWVGKLGLNMLLGFIWAPLAFLPLIASLILILTKNGMTVWDAVAGTRVVSIKK